MEKAATGADILEVWNEETVPKVMRIVSTRLSQRDLISPFACQPLDSSKFDFPPFAMVLDFHEMNTAGDRLVAALSLLHLRESSGQSLLHCACRDPSTIPGEDSLIVNAFLRSKYQNVKHINLEFARDVEDKHLEIVKSKGYGCGHSIKNLEVLNLNGCQKISDMGIEFITCNCPKLKVFSIYWNVRVSDLGISNLVKNCKLVVDLNLSGCKNVTDESLKLIADNYQELQLLNLTRCVKLTDKGLRMILLKCSSLRSLNLYALSSLTDVAYEKISVLSDLEFLVLCGAQCKKCVRVTDQGAVATAQGCRSLEFLSLFGIVGVTDKSLEVLSSFCSNTVTTLDVNGCVGIKTKPRSIA
ncbi:hypothetical protein OROGR_017362 [Orobanche gracilis]